MIDQNIFYLNHPIYSIGRTDNKTDDPQVEQCSPLLLTHCVLTKTIFNYLVRLFTDIRMSQLCSIRTSLILILVKIYEL